jgi:hypothetical protein
MVHIRRNELNNAFHGIHSFSRSCFSASQEIPRLLYNLKVIFHVDKSPPLYPIMNHRNLMRTFIFCFLKIHLNLSVYGPTVILLDLGYFFSFLILYIVGRTSWAGDQPVERPLPKHRTTQIQNKRTRALCGMRTHVLNVRASEGSSCLRPRGHSDRLASERAKTVHALDRAATVTG